jgi:hypothetical protein
MIQALNSYSPTEEQFTTPEYAVEPLVPYLNKQHTIWECTDTLKQSGIVSCLRRYGFTVESSGIDEWNFLTDTVAGFDCIVTNPPYPQKDAFIERCIEYNTPFALLMPLTALEGIRRHRLWKSIEDEFGIIVLDKRVSYTGGGIWFNTSWFTRKLFQGVRFVQL